MNTENCVNVENLFNLIRNSDFDERQLLEIAKIVKKDNIFQTALDNNKIWQAKGENDKRWKFKTKDGKIVARKEKEKIKEAYLKYLEESEKEQTEESTVVNKGPDMTYKVLFQNWLDYKSEYVGTKDGNLSPTTYRRYLRDYDKFIKGTDFEEMKIGKITAITIEHFLKSMVDTYHPKKQCLTNVAGYISSSLGYACKNDDIEKNPYEKVDIAPIRNLCETSDKKDSERTLTTEEMIKLLVTIHKAQDENELYMPNYAIELSLLTGMRVGELAALKWECVCEDGIHIRYAERRFDYKDGPTVIVIGDTKNRKHRFFPMTDDIKVLMERIKAVQNANGIDSEYVFAGAEGRYSEHSISQAVYRRCIDAGIEKKSIHDIRRTVSSNLRAILPRAVVSSMLGHTEETNDRYYDYDVKTMAYKKKALDGYQSSLYGKNGASA